MFARLAVFGVVTGAVYGGLTREPAGIVLLIGFGGASAVVAIGLILGSRLSRRGRDGRLPGFPTVPPEGSAAAPPVPPGSAHATGATSPGWAPLGVAIGVGTMALGLAFGPWLLIVGLVVAAGSAQSWLSKTVDEAESARRSAVDLDHPTED